MTSPTSLRSEEEIISTWKGDIHKPLVSIRCITFNHSAYIEDAIKGFLIQETNFPIEVWIHDDASTDGTQEIVKHYQNRYPRIIKTILQKENQYSKGMMPSKFVDPVCTGDYYADCEGDDWWISSTKLQRQVEVLESRPDIGLAFSKAYKVCGENRTIEGELGFNSPNNLEFYNLGELLHTGLASIPTASVLLRSSILNSDKYRDFLDEYRSSFVIKFLASINGGAAYINEHLCCYRVNVPGSHSERVRNDMALKIKFFKRVNNALSILNDYADTKYDNEVKAFQRKRLFAVLGNSSLDHEQLSEVLASGQNSLSSLERKFLNSKIARIFFFRKVMLRWALYFGR